MQEHRWDKRETWISVWVQVDKAGVEGSCGEDGAGSRVTVEKMGPGSGGGCGNYEAWIEGSCGKDGAWVNTAFIWHDEAG